MTKICFEDCIKSIIKISRILYFLFSCLAFYCQKLIIYNIILFTLLALIENEAIPLLEKNINSLNSPPVSYTLILSLEELTRSEFADQFGINYLMQDHTTAVSEKIARVKINRDILKADLIQPEDKLLIRVSNDTNYKVIIDNTNLFSDTFSMRGRIETPVKGIFMLAITDNQTLVSLRFEETDLFYLIKYNIHDQEHYLFKTKYHLVNYFNEGGGDKIAYEEKS